MTDSASINERALKPRSVLIASLMINKKPPRYLKLAIPCPLRQTFDYLPEPGKHADDYPIGSRVKAPFGSREAVGYVLDHTDNTDVDSRSLKAIAASLDDTALLDAPLIEIAAWMSDYYHHPIGDTLSHFLPNLLKKASSANPYSVRCWQVSTHGLGLGEKALNKAPKQQLLLTYLAKSADAWSTDEQIKRAGHTLQTARELLKKGLLTQALKPVVPDQCAGIIQGGTQSKALIANCEQQQALALIEKIGRKFDVVLLEGVTGSGKTEVYLQAIERALARNEQAVVLVPEIGLTPQTINRFAQRFDVKISVFHSGLSDKERLAAWQAARNGETRIIIGTRSAVFTALDKPGLIIVDEEHDSSYKQQEGLHYHARDIAVVRAQKANIPVILGSATPSLETLHNVQSGKYKHCQLLSRAANAALPQISTLDIRRIALHHGLADASLAAISETLSRGQQAMVFINRRGYAPLIMCHDCGWYAGCEHCDARLTYHATARHLRCHHCDLIKPLPTSCPRCQSRKLEAMGQGTERTAAALETLFPDTTVVRIDRDTIHHRDALNGRITTINSGEPLIIVGTQMLAKGHHFPLLTTVVMLDIDQGLYHPDFRAAEKTLQLLTQVAGRAGRVDTGKKKPPAVIIQTHLPDHPLLQAWLANSYQGICEQLLNARKAYGLPPFEFMGLIRADSKKPEAALDFLRAVAEQLRQSASTSPKQATNSIAHTHITGPLPTAMEKRAGRHRAQLVLRSSHRRSLHQTTDQAIALISVMKKKADLRWHIDIDPQDSI